MKIILVILGVFLTTIWFLASVFLGAVARIEKKETKDSSWKISWAVFIFSVLNTIVIGALTLGLQLLDKP